MTSTEILTLDEISSSQASKEVTHNTALRQLEGRLVRVKDKDLTAPPGSPANGDTYIVATGGTGDWSGHDGKIAHYYGGAWHVWAPIEGIRVWVNDEDLVYAYTGAAWTAIAGGALTAPFPDGTAIVKGSSDGTKLVRFEVDGLTTATTRVVTVADLDVKLDSSYDVGGFYPGVPTASALVSQYPFPRSVKFPSGLTGSQGKAGTAATAQTDFDIQKNGSSVGTMRFAVSATVASFIMGSETTFSAGDVLKVIAPVTPDATLANVSFALAGVKT